MSVRTIVTTDGSEASRKVEEFVLRLNRALSLHVMLVHVIDLRNLEYKSISDLEIEMIRKGARRAAEGMIEKERLFLEQSGVNAEVRLLEGAPGEAICDAAERERASLVVIGRRGHGDLQDWLFGSVSNHVLQYSPKPVLVIKRRGPISLGDDAARPLRVLMAVDESEATQRCLDWLASSTEYSTGMELTLLHVVNPNRHGLEYLAGSARDGALADLKRSGEDLLQKVSSRLQEHGFPVKTRVEEGTPGKTLCRVYYEENFELIVMTRRALSDPGETGLGQISYFVVHHCAGHVLIVP